MVLGENIGNNYYCNACQCGNGAANANELLLHMHYSILPRSHHGDNFQFYVEFIDYLVPGTPMYHSRRYSPKTQHIAMVHTIFNVSVIMLSTLPDFLVNQSPN